MDKDRKNWQMYHTTGAAWEAMLAAVKDAEESVCFEQYAMEGEISEQFLQVFEKKAKEGVKVKLLLDSIGCLYILTSSWPERLREAGAEVRFFAVNSKYSLYNFVPAVLRTHRKILTIDNKIAFIGGVVEVGGMKTVRDTHVQYQIPEVVSGACDSFDLLWGLVSRLLPLPVLATTTPAGEDFQVLTNGPGRKRSFIYKNLLARIKSAQKRIWLVTPYFSPPPKLVQFLKNAAKRGVDCQVIIPQQSDKIATNLSARSAFTRLLESEVTIRLYQDDLHAKYFVIDGWGSVGSCNLDYLSFFLNHEMNVATESEDFVDELTDQFKKDCSNTDTITKEEWDRAGWWETAKATAGHILRPIA